MHQIKARSGSFTFTLTTSGFENDALQHKGKFVLYHDDCASQAAASWQARTNMDDVWAERAE